MYPAKWQYNKIIKQGMKNYFCAFLYNTNATMINTRLGIQAAINGGRSPLIEKTVENLSAIIKTAAMAIPMAM